MGLELSLRNQSRARASLSIEHVGFEKPKPIGSTLALFIYILLLFSFWSPAFNIKCKTKVSWSLVGHSSQEASCYSLGEDP